MYLLRLIVLLGIAAFVPFIHILAAPFKLVKSASFDTVYYIDAGDVRHPFPNKATYESWYGSDFSEVITISDELLATYPIGPNIVIRSGNLVKVPSARDVYVTEPGGALRKIDHEDLAEYFFGSNWNRKVSDLPEVFFGNYIIADPIKSRSDIPDGVVYQIIGEDTYYLKERDILTRFKSFDEVVSNKFDTETIIQNTRTYFTRNHIISDVEEDLFNPVIATSKNTADCSAEQLRVGIVFLHDGEVLDSDLANLTLIKERFPAYWNTQSRTFSNIHFSSPIQLRKVNTDNRISNEFGRFEVTHEIGFEYFDQLSDTVDFIIVFTDFPVGEKHEAFFSPITQSLEGIGKIRLDRSAIFGSQGKLKGIVVMGDIATFSFFEQRRIDSLFNILSHEILHNWSGTLKFLDDDGTIQSDLLAEDGKHWSPWLSFSSPLGGKGWHSTNDGIYSIDSGLSESLAIAFSDLDLYAMGLLPAQVIKPFGYINTSIAEPSGQTTAEPFIEVTIEQIISASGKVRCVTP